MNNEELFMFIQEQAEICAKNMVNGRNDDRNVQFWRGSLSFADLILAKLQPNRQQISAEGDNVLPEVE